MRERRIGRALLPVAAILLLCLGGCAELQRFVGLEPASSPPPPETLPPPETPHVTVLPVAGLADLATGDRLAAAMVDALDATGVRASVFGSQPGQLFLSGALATTADAPGRQAPAQPPAMPAPGAEGSGGASQPLTLRWELAEGEGRVLGQVTQSAAVDRFAFAAGTDEVLRGLAKQIAPQLAQLVNKARNEAATAGQSQGSGAADAAGAPPEQTPPRPALVAVRAATGAPGDGNTALALAMKRALRQLGLGLTAEEGGADAVLDCTVTLSAAGAGRQSIAILWRLGSRDGRELGRIEQANTVPQGSLDGPWGPVAIAVADAAAAGVLDLMPKPATPPISAPAPASAAPPSPAPAAPAAAAP